MRVESENPVYDSRNNCNAIIETASNTLIRGCKNTIIPNNIKSIGESAFSFCTSLTSISIPISVTSEAFTDCTDLTTLFLPTSVESIGGRAFSGCTGLTSIEFSEGLKKIGDGCFSGCNSLKLVELPKSLKLIGASAFSSCYSIETIFVKDGNPYYYSPDNSNCIIETASNTLIIGCKNTIIPNGIVTIGNAAFAGCKELSSIDIPNSVNRIGDSAFSGCSALSSIDIPNSVYSIGEMAFSACSSLTSIVLPSSVSVIHGAVFYHCDNLASVTIYNCSYFEYQYFSYCPKLKDIYLYMELAPQVSYNAFTYTDIGNITLHVPASSINTYRTSEPWRSFKEIVEIDMTDNITSPVVKNNSGKDIYYNLNGQREVNPSKGIYIRNGKKIIVR